MIEDDDRTPQVRYTNLIDWDTAMIELILHVVHSANLSYMRFLVRALSSM
jgi:hypothetical protein